MKESKKDEERGEGGAMGGWGDGGLGRISILREQNGQGPQTTSRSSMR